LTCFSAPPGFSALQYEVLTAFDDFIAAAATSSPKTSKEKESVSENAFNERKGDAFQLEGAQYKLVSAYCNHEASKMLGAYCPLEEYCEAMEDVPRRKLVVEHVCVEVALLEEIKIRISAAQDTSDINGSCQRRPKRSPRSVLPDRPTMAIKKWKGQHVDECGFCGFGGDLLCCYNCSAVIHVACAEAANQSLETASGRGRQFARDMWPPGYFGLVSALVCLIEWI